MRVGYYQYCPGFGDVQKNFETVETALDGVKADLIVLPELAFTGYGFQDRNELMALSQDVSDSGIVRRLTGLCKANDLYLVTGFAERCGQRLYNAALVIGPAGVVHCYRKLHLFNTEKAVFDPGDIPLKPVAVQGVNVGVMICFDWVFPEVARSLALQGADLICQPSNLVLTHCQRVMQARSLENSVYSVTANRIGKEDGPRGELRFTGQSQIAGPGGDVMASSGADEAAVVIADIDISRARNKFITERNDVFADRRPEFYGALVREAHTPV